MKALGNSMLIRASYALACFVPVFQPACVMDAPNGDGDVAGAKSAFLPGAADDNASSSSSLKWNRVSWNRVSWNRVSWNRVSWDDLTVGQQLWHEVRSDSLINAPLSDAGTDPQFTAALTDPDVRYLFEYIVSCALPSDASVTHVDDDSAQWTFSGLHGMAPEWESDAACDTTCQRSVSACLYARLNYYGQRNVLSWRSGIGIAQNEHTEGMEQPSDDENKSFKLDEGAVWGNLFLETAELWVCRGADTILDLTLPGVDLTMYGGMVPMGAIRMCAGDQNCLDNVYVGPCWTGPDKVCGEKRSDNGAYYQCAAPGGAVYDEVLTIHRADFGFHADFVPGAGLDPQLSSCADAAANHNATATCKDDWDQSCVEYAKGAGWELDPLGDPVDELGCNNGLIPGTGHSVLETGATLGRDTSTCTAYVCAIDGDCCDNILHGWDADCVELADQLCK